MEKKLLILRREAAQYRRKRRAPNCYLIWCPSCYDMKMERKNAIEIVKNQAMRIEVRPNGNTRLYFASMTMQKSMAKYLNDNGVEMIEYLEGIEI